MEKVTSRRVFLDGEFAVAAEDRARPGAAKDLERPLEEHHGVVRPEEAGDHQRHLRHNQLVPWPVPLFVQQTHQDSTSSISVRIASRDWYSPLLIRSRSRCS